jgi:hypothetical protein
VLAAVRVASPAASAGDFGRALKRTTLRQPYFSFGFWCTETSTIFGAKKRTATMAPGGAMLMSARGVGKAACCCLLIDAGDGGEKGHPAAVM